VPWQAAWKVNFLPGAAFMRIRINGRFSASYQPPLRESYQPPLRGFVSGHRFSDANSSNRPIAFRRCGSDQPSPSSKSSLFPGSNVTALTIESVRFISQQGQ